VLRHVLMPLRIAQFAPPFESIPPSRYGGTERVVATLTEGLVRRGHAVTLFASGDSTTSARLVSTVETALWHDSRVQSLQPFFSIAVDTVYQHADEFDVIHNHMDFHPFPAARLTPHTPTVSTLHGRLDLLEWQFVLRHFADMPLVSVSDAQRVPHLDANWIATIHHGIDLREFPFQPQRGAYLASLGRISPEKGLDAAIRIARRAGVPLKIAARMPLDLPADPEARRDWHYYRNTIEPLLREPGVEFVGEVAGAEKSAFLRGAAALLFPICWPEPFGLVMIEALASGTPVLAFRRGSVPEIVDHGITGFVADEELELARAVDRLSDIDRHRCRIVAEERFSAEAMVINYERVYQQLLIAPRSYPPPSPRPLEPRLLPRVAQGRSGARQ
jgi:glycosyltransferase involved in cell wall biosynthesis